MRRSHLLVFLVMVMSLALIAVPVQRIGAQDATPAAEEAFELPEGLTFEPLAHGTTENLPAARIDFELFRLRFEPGVVFQAGEDDPSLALVYVEAGALTAVVAGPMTVLRAAESGTPFPETEEVPAGEAFTLQAGDSALFPPNVNAEVRNDEAEPVVLLVAETSPATSGGEDGAGTPAP